MIRPIAPRDDAPHRSWSGREGPLDLFGGQSSGPQPCLHRNVPCHQMRQAVCRRVGVLSPHDNTGAAVDYQIESMGVQRGAGRCGRSNGTDTGSAAQGRSIADDR